MAKRNGNDNIYSKSIYENDDMNISSFSNPEEKFIVGNGKKPKKEKRDGKVKKEKNYRSPFHKAIAKVGLVFATMFLVLIITASILGITLTIYILAFAKSDIDFDINTLKLQYTTIVYANDAEGKPVELERLHSIENREWADIKEIPQTLQDAFKDIEDHRFESHNGVDWKRTSGAFANMFFKFWDTQQGGSTITQQLIRVISKDKDVHVDRKMREILRALELEKKATKPQILEAYMNTIYLGRGCYGVRTAATFYFNKELEDLTVAECACLAGITRNPDGNNPVSNLEVARGRTEQVLNSMYEQEHIKEKADYEKYLEEARALEPVKKEANTVKPPQSYYVDMVIEDVIADLMEEKGYERDRASGMLFSGGLRIYTNMDSGIQKILEDFYVDPSNFPKNKSIAPSGKKDDPANGQSIQSSTMVMDYQGRVMGVVGGIGEKVGDRTQNRATQSPRQPGSSIKPISVYAPSLEINKIHYSKILKDSPIQVDGKNWPKNSYNSYTGSMPLTNAIERSSNAVAVQLCVNVLSAKHCFDFLEQKFGFTTLVRSQKDQNGKVFSDINASAMGVGGMTHGVTVRDMTAAFATFGALGKYYKPQSYSVVKTFSDEILLERDNTSFSGAVNEDTAYIMNRLLRFPVEGSQGTAKSAKFGDFQIYGKTGTTTDNYDKWFVGGTPHYIAALWSGYDLNADLGKAGVPDSVSISSWKKIMEKIHTEKALKPKDFPTSTKIDYRRYCTSTGNLATTACTGMAWGYYKKSSLPAKCSHGGDLLDSGTLPELNSGSSGTSGSSGSASSKSTDTSAIPGLSSVSQPPDPITKSSPASSSVPSSTPSSSKASEESSSAPSSVASQASSEPPEAP